MARTKKQKQPGIRRQADPLHPSPSKFNVLGGEPITRPQLPQPVHQRQEVACHHARSCRTAAPSCRKHRGRGVEGTAAAPFPVEGVGNWHKTTGGGRESQAGGPSAASTAERPKKKDARSPTKGASPSWRPPSAHDEWVLSIVSAWSDGERAGDRDNKFREGERGAHQHKTSDRWWTRAFCFVSTRGTLLFQRSPYDATRHKAYSLSGSPAE